MIEISSYRVVVKRVPYDDEARSNYSSYEAKIDARRARVESWIKEQAEAYKDVGDGYSLGSDRGDAHLSVEADDEGSRYIFQISSTGGFERFLKQQPANDEIETIEKTCGVQYRIFAGFIPVPSQHRNFGSVGSMRADEFNRAAYGINPGRALTQPEVEARAAMCDASFEKLTKFLTQWKAYSGKDAVVELKEAGKGCYHLRVTPKELDGVTNAGDYNLTSGLANLEKDPDFAGIFSGPAIYPSEIARERAEKERQEQARLEKERAEQAKKPRSFDL